MRTYRFRIYPSNRQTSVLESTINLCRELYNAMLQQRIYAYRSGKRVKYNSQQDEIPEIKNAFPEYRSIHSQVLQDVARRLDKAYGNFFRRTEEKNNGKNIKAGFPRFKSKERYSSITYPQSGFRIMDNDHVRISKTGEVRMFMRRTIIGNVLTLSIKRDHAGDWFITFVTDSLNETQQTEKEERDCVKIIWNK